MYTLKLDWSANRINTVARYLSRYRSTKEASDLLQAIAEDMQPSETTTLKVQWRSDTIAAVIAKLDLAMRTITADIEHARYGQNNLSYDDLVCDSALIHAARRDITEYLASTELARRTTEENTEQAVRMRDAIQQTDR